MGTRIRGILTVVPPNVRPTADLAVRYGQADAARIEETTGIRQVYLHSPGHTAGDLAAEAAARLLTRLGLSPRDVQGIVFVTQSPDFVLPSTACILQDRLGLPKQSLAFDVNLGCSAYPYGLAIASGLFTIGLAERILLLGADMAMLIHPDDRSALPLFGEAAVATLLENDPTGSDLLGFDLGTDGKGWKNLVVPVGGLRYPALSDFQAASSTELRGAANPEYVHMDGAEIFTFTLREVPGIIQRTLANAKTSGNAVDYYFFHQANKFILDHLVKKMRLPPEKCPLSIGCFGNTSGVSAALTASYAASEANRQRDLSAMFVAFGVGYSWGGVLTRLRAGALLPIEHL